MNAIDLLKQQHDRVQDALEEMSTLSQLDPTELRLVADELVAHMVIEEHVFYPRVRELDQEIVAESYEEHAVARFELARLMTAKAAEQRVRIGVLKDLVDQHIEEEETELFPRVQSRVSRDELERLGARMEALFEKAVREGLEKLVAPTDQSLVDGQSRMAPKRAAGGRPPRAPAPRPRARSHVR
jgi:hemerythrin superfamily protein